jgi:hypothetical protein
MEGYYIPQHPKIKAKEGNLPTQLSRIKALKEVLPKNSFDFFSNLNEQILYP